jgi:hypothetical protein
MCESTSDARLASDAKHEKKAAAIRQSGRIFLKYSDIEHAFRGRSMLRRGAC